MISCKWEDFGAPRIALPLPVDPPFMMLVRVGMDYEPEELESAVLRSGTRLLSRSVMRSSGRQHGFWPPLAVSKDVLARAVDSSVKKATEQWTRTGA